MQSIEVLRSSTPCSVVFRSVRFILYSWNLEDTEHLVLPQYGQLGKRCAPTSRRVSLSREGISWILWWCWYVLCSVQVVPHIFNFLFSLFIHTSATSSLASSSRASIFAAAAALPTARAARCVRPSRAARVCDRGDQSPARRSSLRHQWKSLER